MSLNTNWHNLSLQQVLDTLDSKSTGLSEIESKKRLEKFGLNTITKVKKRSMFFIFLKQVKDPLVLILFFAIFLSFTLKEIADGLIIAAILLMTIVVGSIQEYRSEKAIDALIKITATTCRVIRDNKERIIDTKFLVPGDVLLLYPGDKVPADSYLIEGYNVETNEASLTGESLPVQKMECMLSKDTPIHERKNILYAITTIVNGRAKAIVFETAKSTEIGKIAKVIESINVQKTPLELKIKHTVKIISLFMLIIVGIITIISLIRGIAVVDIVIWSISLSVAAVPEALPAIITASLTVGAYRMTKKNALIRNLPAIETLGLTTVICSDKTGTLTKGEMTAKQIYLYNQTIEIPEIIFKNAKNGIPNFNVNKNDLMSLIKCAVLCNDAEIGSYENEITKMLGDPTEIALLIFAKKFNVMKKDLSNLFPRQSEIPFIPERKMMVTVHRAEENLEIFAKGAPEVILNKCNRILKDENLLTMTEDIKGHILSINHKMANNGFRVIALAFNQKQIADKIPINFTSNNNDFIFLGLVGFIDPPRKEVKDAINQCKTAGINVVMLTGDQKFTALAVAKEIGIVNKYETDIDMMIVSGQELDNMDSKVFSKKVKSIKVYCRVLPEQKLRIIQELQNDGHIVAVTGDGVNDAPALKAADIGISMGITGTDVAKESSSMILADDNFATIVSAIHEGRRIFDNIKKYLIYLLSANLSEILILTLAVVMGWPFPLLAKHILYINLATDGSPAIALSMEHSEPDVMKRKPRKTNETIFYGMKKWLIPIPLILTVVSLLLFWNTLNINGWDSEQSIAKARTMVFILIVFFELFFAFSCRSFRHNIHQIGFLRNKFLMYSILGESALIIFIANFSLTQEIFDLVPLELIDWIVVLLLSTLGYVYSETIKLIKKQ